MMEPAVRGIGKLIRISGARSRPASPANWLDHQLVHALDGLVQPAAHVHGLQAQAGQMRIDMRGGNRHHLFEHLAAFLAEAGQPLLVDDQAASGWP